MIVTNILAKIIIWLACLLTPGTVGVTIWPCIFIHPASLASNRALIAHETVHLEQYKRYWIVGFLPVYTYYFIKYGYMGNPLEVEAYNKSRQVSKKPNK